MVWFGSSLKWNRRPSELKENMKVVAIEELPDIDLDPPPGSLSIMSLKNQFSATSVQSDISSFNETIEYSSDNYYSSNRMSETCFESHSDTWRDAGGSDSERQILNENFDDAKLHHIENKCDDLSEIIFLSPHWLLQSMRKILTHHLEDDIEMIV